MKCKCCNSETRLNTAGFCDGCAANRLLLGDPSAVANVLMRSFHAHMRMEKSLGTIYSRDPRCAAMAMNQACMALAIDAIRAQLGLEYLAESEL